MLCALPLTTEDSDKSRPLIPEELAALKLLPCHHFPLFFCVNVT